MDKINWINGQAGGTPLSAENLNLMQDNIEDAIDEVEETTEGTVLFEDLTGTTNDITLTNDSFTNYSRVKIFGFDDYGNQVFTEFLPNVSKNVELSTIVTGSGTHYIKTQEYTFTSTSLNKYRRAFTNIQGNEFYYNPTNHWIYITKIIGYKY